MNIIEVVIYIFPKRRFFVISRPVIRTVLYSVGMSSVDVKVSAKPNGSISGTQPAGNRVHKSFKVAANERKKTEHAPLAYSMAQHPSCILYCLATPRRMRCTSPGRYR